MNILLTHEFAVLNKYSFLDEFHTVWLIQSFHVRKFPIGKVEEISLDGISHYELWPGGRTMPELNIYKYLNK